MEYRSLGKRSRDDSESIRSSESHKHRRGDNSVSTGFASGEAGRYHLRFTGTATIHLNLDIESLYKEIKQRQGIAAQRHEEQNHTEPDLELRLGPPSAQREGGNPTRLDGLVTHDFHGLAVRTQVEAARWYMNLSKKDQDKLDDYWDASQEDHNKAKEDHKEGYNLSQQYYEIYRCPAKGDEASTSKTEGG